MDQRIKAVHRVMNYILPLIIICLGACSDKSKDSFELGKMAYDSGNFDRAKTFFFQVDSLSQWNGQARKFLQKIDSISALSSAAQSETQIQEITYNDEYFTDQNLVLDTSQFQLIDQTCALFSATPEERRHRSEVTAAEQAIQDSIEWASRTSDSVVYSDDDQAAADDGMWYQYKYEEQFETLKELGISTVRVQNKRYIRFIDKNKKAWTLINKDEAFFGDGIVLFSIDKRPIHLYLTDFGSDQIREYFSNN